MRQNKVVSQNFTRQQLYDLVWSSPIKTLAAQYGISDVAFSKSCRRHNIPVPPRGHWAKVQSGKKSPRPPLLARGLGMPEVIWVGGGNSWAYRQGAPTDLIEMEIPPPPEFKETLPALTARVRKLIGKVTIPKDLRKAHRLVAKLLDEDEARAARQLEARYSFSWDAPRFESPFERRRLRLVNAIFVVLERTGMRPSLRGKDPQDFGVRVGDESVSFTLDHPKQQRDGYRPASDRNRPASDMLRLAISNWRNLDEIPLQWEDRAENRIEDHIEDIVVGLVVAGEMQYRQGEISQHQWLIRRKAELLEEARKRKMEEERLERERRIKAEKARVDRLLGEAQALRQANDIRTYVQDVQRANAESNDPVPEENLAGWASWALAQADRIDPVLSRRFLIPSSQT